MLIITLENTIVLQQDCFLHSNHCLFRKTKSPAAAGLFVLNSSSYIEAMKSPIIILILVLLYAAGCGRQEGEPQEKADILSQQALEEMNRQNYEEAERLLIESISLHSETNNEAKLAENYSTLSTIQLLSGKLTPALETLAALREIFRHGADRSAELQTMLQTAKIYFQLGKTDDAAALLAETHNNGKLYRLGHIAMTAALDLANLHASLHQYDRCSNTALNALNLAKDLQHQPSQIEALQLRMTAAAALGETDKAFGYYRDAAALVASDPRSDRVGFALAAGHAFTLAGEWAFAKTEFSKVTALSESKDPSLLPEAEITARIGLGELYLHHYAFDEAQQQFIRAYNIARTAAGQLTQSYLLIRIGDCLAQRLIDDPQESTIRAEQLYEQAMTLFTRSGALFGEAVALHRLGRLKESNGDDNGAITFYKRAFDKFSDPDIDPLLFTGPVSIARLIGGNASIPSAAEWFTNDLIVQLLKVKRNAEAYAYQQSLRTLRLTNSITPLSLRFINPQKEKRFVAFRQSRNIIRQNILESFHSLSGSSSSRNRNYLNKLQQQISYARSKAQSDAVTLAREFQSFSFLTFSKKSPPETVAASLPSSHAVLDYFIAQNQAWVFILRPDEELRAVKLSSFGYALENKMMQFQSMLTPSALQNRELPVLAGELFDFLLRPAETGRSPRVIIIPPLSHEQFPFHSLTDRGTPVIERTGISYLPHVGFTTAPPSAPKFINSTAAFGFTSNTRWGLEFELRDIRSFFRNIQVNNNQTATKERLESSVGEILQISSQFSQERDGTYRFALSDGTTSRAGVNFPVSDFAQLHPFQIVILSDVRSDANSISGLHPLLWLLNGSGSVVVNHYPVTSAMSRTFGENFYASMSSEINPYLAYRRGTAALLRKKEGHQEFGGAAYFYYGVK